MANTQTTTLSQANCRKVFVQRDFSQVCIVLYIASPEQMFEGVWSSVRHQIPSWAWGENWQVAIWLHHHTIIVIAVINWQVAIWLHYQHPQLALRRGWKGLLLHVTIWLTCSFLLLSFQGIVRDVWLVWPLTSSISARRLTMRNASRRCRDLCMSKTNR